MILTYHSIFCQISPSSTTLTSSNDSTDQMPAMESTDPTAFPPQNIAPQNEQDNAAEIQPDVLIPNSSTSSTNFSESSEDEREDSAKDHFCAQLVGEIAQKITKEAMKLPEVMEDNHYARLGLILANYARGLGVKICLESDEDEMIIDGCVSRKVCIDNAYSFDSLAKSKGCDLERTSNLDSTDADLELDDDDSDDDNSDDSMNVLNHPDTPKMLWDFTQASEPSFEEYERVSAYFDVLLSKASRTIHPTMRQL